MKTLYLECNMGISGDMLLSALAEVLDNDAETLAALNGIGIKGVQFNIKKTVKHGITGTHIDVLINGEQEGSSAKHTHTHHHHSHPADIYHIIKELNLPDTAKSNALKIYENLAAAEAKAHNRPVTEIHFHEVGNLDAIADITGVCLLMSILNPDDIIASPINTGYGTVKCAHGLLPVPAPATAELLKNIPIYAGTIEGELTTPTGAALISHFAKSFGKMPELIINKIGYGMGNKDFAAVNCIRAFLSETSEPPETSNTDNSETIAELVCNTDDCTPEALSFAMDILLENGAKDVFISPIIMKKNRPAHKLTCLCDKDKAEQFAALMLKHTTTFGVRCHDINRYTLSRTTEQKDTPYGKIRVKHGEGYGVKKTKPEIDDVYAAARQHNTDIQTVIRCIDEPVR